MNVEELLDFQPTRQTKRRLIDTQFPNKSGEVPAKKQSINITGSKPKPTPVQSNNIKPVTTYNRSNNRNNSSSSSSSILNESYAGRTSKEIADIRREDKERLSKRKAEEEEKLRLLLEDQNENQDVDANSGKDEESITAKLDLLTSSSGPVIESDPSALRKMLSSLQKKYSENQKLRIKYQDQPQKFMDIEFELYQEIQSLRIISTCPSFYSQMVSQGQHELLLQLLSHENPDIATSVSDLLREMLDIDPLHDDTQSAKEFSEALLEGQIIALLVLQLQRLNEKDPEESQGVHNILGLVENMTEFHQDMVINAAGEQGLLIWLLKRIRHRTFDANKLYSTEILSIILQNNIGNQQLLGAKNGIDSLLEALSYYQKRQPETADETEMLENLFDCLCMCLTHPPNRIKLLEGEGLQLMVLLLKDRKMCRRSALKVINHALQGRDGLDNCAKFVEIYGLRTIFPFFMIPTKLSKKNNISSSEQDEHVISIILSLLQNLTGQIRERVVAKFVEKDMEKIERLVELHLQYKEINLQSEIKLKNILEQDELDLEEVWNEDSIYLQRLDGGLFVFQHIDLITIELISSGHSYIKDRIHKLLNQKGDSMDNIKIVVQDFILHMGDVGDTDTSYSGMLYGNTTVNEKQRLQSIIDEM